MNTLLYWIKRAIPSVILGKVRPPYHLFLSYIGSVICKHPSKDIVVIGVTGTKGKSTVTELITAILEADGKKVASLSTIQFKIGDDVFHNRASGSPCFRMFMVHSLVPIVERFTADPKTHFVEPSRIFRVRPPGQV